MPKKLIKSGILLAMVFVVISLLFVTAGATTVDVLDGKVSVTDSANSNTVSGGTVTIKASGSLFGKKTNNITITNNSGAKAKISFDYTADKASSFKIAGATAATSGSYSAVLEADASLSIVLVSNSGLSNTTATLKLSNFILTVAAESSNITINYDSTLGSVTAGGTAVESGGVVSDVTLANGVALVAAPSSGAEFLGWVDEDGKILSTATSYTLTPSADMTVKAAFAKDGGTPWFAVGAKAQKSQSSGFLGLGKIYYYTVGATYLYDDLNAATQKASSDSTNKTVVLMNNGTLPAGKYSIPFGVTLLIPFDVDNTLYTTQPIGVERYNNDANPKDRYVIPKAFRTLTLAAGAELEIEGEMSLSAKHTYAQGGRNAGGSPTESVGFVCMEKDSKITVKSGGFLYVYGYITGSGSVEVLDKGTVYELFQFMDFRGGDQTTKIKNEVFPLSQYYVQNIEVPLTLYAGATEYVYTTIYMSRQDMGTAVLFVGTSDAMFNLGDNSYLVKRYDGSTDRLITELHGKATVSSMKLTFGSTDIDSSEYVLPINSNISITLKEGSEVSVTQDLALLPGTEFIIEKDAKCSIAKGIRIYVYDQDSWGGYCGAGNKELMPIIHAPSKAVTRTASTLVDAKIVVDGTLDVSEGYLYTTDGGANIISNGTGKVILALGGETVTYQITQAGDPSDSTYPEIPITPAYLKNANGTYVTPKVADTFKYTNGKWICETHTLVEAQAGKEGATYSLVCGNNCGTCMANVNVAYRLEDYLWLNATVESDLDYEMAGALYQGNYVIRAVGAAEIPNSLLLTFSHNKVSCSLEMNLAAYKTMITDDEDIALIEAMLIYGEAAEDMFGNANNNSAEVTVPSDLPDATQMKDQHESAGNVTVSRYGMTIGFNNCLQFIYGFKVNGETGITDWSNILEIGLLYSPEAGELLAQNSSSAYILYQNEELFKANSGNLPAGVTLQEVPQDSTLSEDDLVAMWAANKEAYKEGFYMITYNMVYADYGKSYNYRPYVLFEDGSVAYGEQFAYSLATYIGNRLSVSTDTAELNLLWATWNFKTVAEKWKP